MEFLMINFLGRKSVKYLLLHMFEERKLIYKKNMFTICFCSYAKDQENWVIDCSRIKVPFVRENITADYKIFL